MKAFALHSQVSERGVKLGLKIHNAIAEPTTSFNNTNIRFLS
jgi:hypothetical protein